MATYQITSRAGQAMGIYEGSTPAAALLAMHRDAGYGPDVVREAEDAPGTLEFATDADARLLGDVDAWTIRRLDAPR